MTNALKNDPVVEAVREKHAAKQEAAKQKYEAHKSAVANGDKKLLIERMPDGLMYVKFEGGGQLPDILKGKFTSLERIKQLVVAKYGDEGMLAQ
jgi:hypothetical protein